MICLAKSTEYSMQKCNRGVAKTTFADGTVSVFQKFALLFQGQNISSNG